MTTLSTLMQRRERLSIELGAIYRQAAERAAELAGVENQIASMTSSADDYVPLKQAAALAGVHLDTTRRWAKGGRGVLRGGRWYLPRSACLNPIPSFADPNPPDA